MRTTFDALGPLLAGLPVPALRDLDEDSLPRRYRAVFISDLHLGTPGCQATALLDFLKSHPSDYLYLVGDIVDGWQLRKRWYWPQAHNDVVQKLLRRARKGCRVIYVPGNWSCGCISRAELPRHAPVTKPSWRCHGRGPDSGVPVTYGDESDETSPRYPCSGRRGRMRHPVRPRRHDAGQDGYKLVTQGSDAVTLTHGGKSQGTNCKAAA